MYSRHASSRITVSFCLCLCLSVTALSAQSPSVSSPSSSTEVVYLLTNSTLLTYNLDRTTGAPTEQGQGVTLDSVTNTVLLPSPTDRFVYLTHSPPTIPPHLCVFPPHPSRSPY